MTDVRDGCDTCGAPLRPQDLEHCGPCAAVLAEWSVIDVRAAMGEAFREHDAAEHQRLLRILMLLLRVNDERLLR